MAEEGDRSGRGGCCAAVPLLCFVVLGLMSRGSSIFLLFKSSSFFFDLGFRDRNVFGALVCLSLVFTRSSTHQPKFAIVTLHLPATYIPKEVG
jgi:hypothetical protein